MDVINERKVFELLSTAAGRPGTPQCFLLTPKLLPALPFSADCCVLQVVKGPHMQLPLPYNKASSCSMADVRCQRCRLLRGAREGQAHVISGLVCSL